MFSKRNEMKDKLYSLKAEYGTTDAKEIKHMVRTLSIEYDKMRINYIFQTMKDQSPRAHLKLCNLIFNKNRYIGRARAIELRHARRDKLGLRSTIELWLAHYEAELLHSQLLDAGYDIEKIKVIEESIKRNYSYSNSTYASPKISDYDIDEYGNVSLQPTWKRYANLTINKGKEATTEAKPTR